MFICRGCEMYGREDLARVATEVETKTEEEVKKYAKAFFVKYKEISDWRKLIKKIEDGEAVIQRRRDLEQVKHNYVYIYVVCLY